MASLFKKAGIRVTKARQAIVSVLAEANHALSQQDIAELLADHQFDKATLYRNLHTLTDHGIVHRIATPGGIWTFALSKVDSSDHTTSIDHAHFICEQCERVFCLPGIQRPIPDTLTDQDFRINKAELRLFGHCAHCQ
ncbi:MAG: Fur family transcriptional regulator [Bacteroidota bacterium]